MFKLMFNKCCTLYTPKIISNTIKNPWINNSLLKCIHHKKNDYIFLFVIKMILIILNFKNIRIY